MSDHSALYEKFGSSISPGETIFKEGDKGDQMFIIQSGKVRVSKMVGGGTHVLAVLDKGDFFGEMAIVNNVKRTATVTAVTQVELLCFNREGFISMINKNAKIALNIIDKLCKRLQNMNLQIQHFVKKDEKALIALNLLYSFTGVESAETPLYYDRTVKDISLNLMISLETVKKYFEVFEKDNILLVQGNQILLSDKEKLQNLVEPAGS